MYVCMYKIYAVSNKATCSKQLKTGCLKETSRISDLLSLFQSEK